ncbi:SRPBCC domain-containing protein [Virgibacillus oceani]
MDEVKDSVKCEIMIRAPLNKVWDALTKPEYLKRWYAKQADVDFQIGGKGYIEHGWGVVSSGIYTEISEGKKFVLESEDGSFKTITILKQENEGVRVSIEYKITFLGEEGEAVKENMLYGTYQFLKNLKSVYEMDNDLRSEMWKGWIGAVHTTSNGETQGSKVLKVGAKGPADRASIQSGDVITALDGEAISGYEDLENAVNKNGAGSIVQLKVIRDGKYLDIACEISEYPVAY